jgi:hypothetical protein
MRSISRFSILAASLLILAGCGKSEKQQASTPTQPEKPAAADLEKKIAANLAQLGDDKIAAEAQRFCAVQNKSRLGSMGVPVKLTVKNVDIYLCCKGCLPAAEKDLEAVVKRANELVIDTSLSQLSAEDRKLAEAQRFCASDGESPLGYMGVPAKIIIKGQPVFLCCAGCEKECRKDEDKTLALVEKLKADSTGKK